MSHMIFVTRHKLLRGTDRPAGVGSVGKRAREKTRATNNDNDVLVHRRRHPGGAAIAAVHDDRFLRMGRSVDRIRRIGVRAQQLRKKDAMYIIYICEGPRVVAKNWSEGERSRWGAYQSSAKLFSRARRFRVVSAFRLPHSPPLPSLLIPFRVAPSHYPATLPTLQCTNAS